MNAKAMNEPDFVALDALWQNRHEPQAIGTLEDSLRNALASSPAHSYALLWRAARCSHFRAMQADEAGDKPAAKEYFAQGANVAREALEQDSTEVEGCFWLGVNEIEAARHTSTLAAFSALKKASAHIERAAVIDETYHFGGPLRVMGRIIHRKPLLLGGSANVAIEYFKRALQIAPHNSTTQIYYVEALLTEQQKPEARRILHEVIAAPDDEEWRWEQARDRRLARELLQTF